VPRRSSTFLDLALALALSACTSASPPPSDGADCPDDVPASCPTPEPSYSKDVAPLLARRCVPCHFPGGIEAPTHDFSKYDVVHTQKGSIVTQIHSCLMPPADAGATAPTPDERAVLLGWIVCGAPQN
jgi:hypothetical protein